MEHLLTGAWSPCSPAHGALSHRRMEHLLTGGWSTCSPAGGALGRWMDSVDSMSRSGRSHTHVTVDAVPYAHPRTGPHRAQGLKNCTRSDLRWGTFIGSSWAESQSLGRSRSRKKLPYTVDSVKSSVIMNARPCRAAFDIFSARGARMRSAGGPCCTGRPRSAACFSSCLTTVFTIRSPSWALQWMDQGPSEEELHETLVEVTSLQPCVHATMRSTSAVYLVPSPTKAQHTVETKFSFPMQATESTAWNGSALPMNQPPIDFDVSFGSTSLDESRLEAQASPPPLFPSAAAAAEPGLNPHNDNHSDEGRLAALLIPPDGPSQVPSDLLPASPPSFNPPPVSPILTGPSYGPDNWWMPLFRTKQLIGTPDPHCSQGAPIIVGGHHICHDAGGANRSIICTCHNTKCTSSMPPLSIRPDPLILRARPGRQPAIVPPNAGAKLSAQSRTHKTIDQAVRELLVMSLR